LSSPWIHRPSVVDGSGIVRSNTVAAARSWPAPSGAALPWHRQQCGAGRPGPDDVLLRRALGLPTLARGFAGAAQVASLPRRALPTSRRVARAVSPPPPWGPGPQLAPVGSQREMQVQGHHRLLACRGGFLRRDLPDRCGSTRKSGRNPRR
jgi:hypothetical protein